MSDTQQGRATSSCNFVLVGRKTLLTHSLVAQQSCLGNCQFSISKQTWLLVTQTTTVISSAFLIASTLYQRRQMNVRKHKRNSWTCKQTIDQSQLGDRLRNCRRIEMVS